MKRNLHIETGSDSRYCHIVNLDSAPISATAGAEAQIIAGGEETLFPVSRQVVQLANENQDLACRRYLTGEMCTLFAYRAGDDPTRHPEFRAKMRDFHWLSGLSPERLKAAGNTEIEEDIEGVFSSGQMLTPFFLPTLRDQINLLEHH